MVENLYVVVCTREENDDIKEFVEKARASCGRQCNVMVVVNPQKIGLAEIYNNMLSNTPTDNNIVVFVHDDIEFLRDGWGEEVVRLFNEYPEYGIIGVAGSKVMDEKATWWTHPGEMVGQVLHKHGGKSWLTAFSPLLDKDLEEVLVVDGLFIAVHTSRITKHFDDERFGMHFYDISLCLDNYLDGKTKIGATTNIRLAHRSVGELKSDWYEAKEKYLEKYRDKLPIRLNDGRK